jgi:lipopolysaccharide/colanic/teichoic acid biosynthesis glycosyltransferase
MLRGNFGTPFNSLVELTPYICVSIGCASVVFLLGGLDRTPWQYSSVAKHLQIIVLTALAVLLALVFSFAANRLEGVARSLPVLQGGLIVSILICARSAARFLHARRLNNKASGHVDVHPGETVLVVGVNTVCELFLLSVREFASGQVQVAGVLAEEPTMQGRTIHQKRILGTVEELHDILESLEVHGIAVDRIVVATAADRLLPHSLEILLEVEKSSNIIVHFLSERLGFDYSSQRRAVFSGRERNSVHAQRVLALVGNVDVDHAKCTGKSFRLAKRIVDVFGATFLIFTLSPVAVLVAFIVALDIGFPVIFWQQRPGLYGRPFKLFKFRTMRAPHDKHSRRIPDDQRSSAIGRMIRRARLDELPQLYNVLAGEMSLIGPRPLLPRDQSPDYAARLSVRPGITGWAQVNGGRIISSSDKCSLDLWYVHNASLVLDLKIVLRTLHMVLFGDRIDTGAVYRARSHPSLKRLLRTEMVPAE